MFVGLSAFPLTPLYEDKLDESSLVAFIEALAHAKVDSIGALGSTGNYAYLSRADRRRVTELSVQHADNIPVFVSIGDTRLQHVLSLAEDAQQAGASAVMLAPVAYQPLYPDEVYELYEQVTKHLSVPLVIYDNPRTTRFEFSPELMQSIAHLPHVSSIKLGGMTQDLSAMRERLAYLRTGLPEHVSLGVSGDGVAIEGLQAGCELWYSALAGLMPKLSQRILHAVRCDDQVELRNLARRMQAVWDCFAQFGGGMRTVATLAVLQGRVKGTGLPAPLRLLGATHQEILRNWLVDMQELAA